ncbi:MAG: Cro/Cl family transcriptional regulator [Candidatus Binataceae bacterium]|nr:Cro/Cl family transcriptional regulator [Candidatus Binataceae bacterium]
MSGASFFAVRSPSWVLTYLGVNITADISSMVLSIIYTDALQGESGRLEIEIEDHDKRWQGPWYPTEGDAVNLLIGYAGEPMLPCGDFQVDELGLGGISSGPPDVFHLRCLAAYITPAMRTLNSAGYENQTLLQIAGTIAGKYGYSVVGAPDALNLSFARVTQRQETDVAFLNRLAQTHNYNFTIRGSQLVFYSRATLEAAAPVATITRSDIVTFNFTNKTHRVYMGAQVSYQDPATKQLLTQRSVAAPTTPTGDTLKLARRCENQQQALLKAQSALHRANMKRATAQLTTIGATIYVAGNNVNVAGFGVNDGVYLIETARHRLTRATGYTTELEARRVD